MSLEFAAARSLLMSGDFTRLFVELLGWDRLQAKVAIDADHREWNLVAIAQKRGLVVYECPASEGGQIPPATTRGLVERRVAAMTYEHIIVFTSATDSDQVWQWVRRSPGRPLARRELHLRPGQSGEALLQRLQTLSFSLAEEDDVTLGTVTSRARAAFDVDRVTARFYERFRSEQALFVGFISGITDAADQAWYGSLMLNRLMFVYFIQKKGMLDRDPRYLAHRLAMTQRIEGKGKFHTFYRYFLRRLFHEGLGQEHRHSDLEALLGEVPYLNGGLFEVHELEGRYEQLDIPDEAFERIFAFFDAYEWHLDTGAVRTDNEISPDVLGYIFEKYINQHELGAYYTKEDITGYITSFTMLPVILDLVRAKRPDTFTKDAAIWALVRQHPERYIPPSMRQGMGRQPPRRVAAGLTDYTERAAWNELVDTSAGLPTETWREWIARSQRYERITARLLDPTPLETAEFVTFNLDLHQFLQDIIDNADGPQIVSTMYSTLQELSVLDPTCGSGAFLFAALNLLEPLYEACLDKMDALLSDGHQTTPPNSPEFVSFRRVLTEVARHPSRGYFILKSIIINNLYGVDVMEEATEICKLRLFLKLISQVVPDFDRDNEGLEALPDVDFNVRCGNTLVGFVTRSEVGDAFASSAQGSLPLGDDAEEVEQQARLVDAALQTFHDVQRSADSDSAATVAAKVRLNEQLDELTERLDLCLFRKWAPGGGSGTSDYEAWRASHQPFHWFVEFHRIMVAGGFDVIIGNPPYIELDQVTRYRLQGYATESCGNLYALVVERAMMLATQMGRLGFIVPVSSVSTDRYVALQQLLTVRELHYSSFDDRPSRLFDGLEHIRLTIHLVGRRSDPSNLHSTRYNKWMADARPALFQTLSYADVAHSTLGGRLPKLSAELENTLLAKLYRDRSELRDFYDRDGAFPVYYSRKVGYFLQVLDFVPLVVDGLGQTRAPSEFKELRFESQELARLALACLNSSLFYWFVTVFSDCRHLNKREVDAFPVHLRALRDSPEAGRLAGLATGLMESLRLHAETRVMRFSHAVLTVQCIIPRHSKMVIDEIDRELGNYFGLSPEEVDFIINYDIKFRVGATVSGHNRDVAM